MDKPYFTFNNMICISCPSLKNWMKDKLTQLKFYKDKNGNNYAEFGDIKTSKIERLWGESKEKLYVYILTKNSFYAFQSSKS